MVIKATPKQLIIKKEQHQVSGTKNNEVKEAQDMCCGTDDYEQKKNSKRCYTCLANFDLKNVVVHPIIDNKEFCSKECLKTEVKNVSVPCVQCKRLIIRPEG